MTSTISESKTEEILQGIKDGTLDYNGITMAEWLQVSFLVAISEGGPPHTDIKIMYGGNLYDLHACVSQITPNQQVSAIRNKI